MCLCCLNVVFSQEKYHIGTDTVKIDNKQIIYQYCVINNTYYNCGSYYEYGASGNLLTSGEYQIIIDSLPCVSCYTLVDSVLTQFHYTSGPVPIRSGVWKFYHNNGNVSAEGSYCLKTRIEGSSTIKLNGNSVYDCGPVGYNFVDLKEGHWNYYSEDGKLIMKEWYVDGVLVWTAWVH